MPNPLDDILTPADPPNPWPHPACLPDDILLKACTKGKGRSSGPGGQHRNKVETHVTLTHAPTDTSAQAGERRSVKDNTRVALRRLRLNLATHHRTAVPAGPIGSALWRSRLKGARIVCNPSHRDYPSLLAEALDVLAAMSFDPRDAATRLACSPSQLIKLIKDHPPAFELLNTERTARNLKPLR